MKLRKQGVGIITTKIDRLSDCGKIHTMAGYVVEVGAAVTAPADKTDGINLEETDKSEDSMEVSL